MPVETTYLDADVEAVEAEEVNLGSCIDVTLSDGVSVVTALRRGQSNSLGMELTGYTDKRRDEISIRASEFLRVSWGTSPEQMAQQTILIAGKSWLITEVNSPDNVIWFFNIVQNW